MPRYELELAGTDHEGRQFYTVVFEGDDRHDLLNAARMFLKDSMNDDTDFFVVRDEEYEDG